MFGKIPLLLWGTQGTGSHQESQDRTSQLSGQEMLVARPRERGALEVQQGRGVPGPRAYWLCVPGQVSQLFGTWFPYL